jgi:hydrogenase expression/formation protein HypE
MTAPATHDRIVLAHGGGGELMGRLIRDHVLPHLKNHELAQLNDAAILPWTDRDRVVFTTDSYVVTPLEFPGGDIGRLAVAGTVNDLAVMGAEPFALSLGLILEEGLPIAVLDRIIASIAATAREAGVEIVTGDTKVIERRIAAIELETEDSDSAAGLFINTAGVGRLPAGVNLGMDRIEPGDVILINGSIADHGLTVMSVRAGLEFESTLRTDAAPLNGLISAVLGRRVRCADHTAPDANRGAPVRTADPTQNPECSDGPPPNVKFLRDPTRGGVASVLADICDTRGLSIEIDEEGVPLTATARHAAEMLGLDPLTVANEGKVVMVVAAGDAERVLAACRAHPLGRHAAIIGRVVAREGEGAGRAREGVAREPALVELLTRAGGRRIIQRPYGEDLPRIC